MPLKTDINTICAYIHDTPYLKTIFFNPFILVIILTILIIIIQYFIFMDMNNSNDLDPDDESQSCTTKKYTFKIILKQCGYYGILLMSFIVMHDILIKAKYRTTVSDLKETVAEIKAIGSNESHPVESLYPQDKNIISDSPISNISPITALPISSNKPITQDVKYNIN